jgi:cysteine-rich repeat protein
MFALVIGGIGAANAALVVTDQNHGVTPAAMATALVGSGVTISNVTFTGNPRAGGAFDNGSPVVGFANGIVLSSGKVQTVAGDPSCGVGIEGPNKCYETIGSRNSTNFSTAGDADLTVLSGFPTFDAAILEFDFVPEFSTVQFQYVFSSEEYSDFSNTKFNDVFGFFINGQNCALVPGTGEPVSINTINNGNDVGGDPTPHNASLFIDNVNPSPSIDTEMDGLTKILTCQANVNPGVSNHMKLATADASDAILDTAVFIQAGSIISTPCPNGVCDPGENCVNCPQDCGSVCCGNGLCDTGENTDNCPADCHPPCGNGTCDTNETCTNCPADCGLCFCGNHTCDPNEDCSTCPGDCNCGPICPDGTCDASETCSSCPADCGPCCGNGVLDDSEQCDPPTTPSCEPTYCSSTCQTVTRPTVCGDGCQDPGEECDDGNTVNGDGCSSTCTIENPQNHDPDCSAAVADRSLLWPPNHKFAKIHVDVTDPDGDDVTVTINGITQDEPLDSYGDGHTCPDADGVGTDTALLRAERARSRLNSRDGRVYHVSFTATDGKGGSCAGVVAVCVPPKRKATCVDEGPLVDSTGPCS